MTYHGRAVCLLFMGLMLFCLGCASAPKIVKPQGVVITPPEYEKLKAASLAVAELRGVVLALKKRIQYLEQRVGLAPLQSKKLRVMPQSERLRTSKMIQVLNPGDRGKKRDLSAYLKGFDGYVIAYWATWCKPCTSDEELVHLKALQQQLRRHNIELVSVVIDDLKKALAHPKANRWLYPLWYGRDAHLEMLPRSFIQSVGVNLPLFLVVSRNGEARYFYNDALDHAAVRDLVTAMATVCRK